jgi:hypothetical protein
MVDRGFDSWQGHQMLLFSRTSSTSLGHTQPPVCCALGIIPLSVKWTGHHINNSSSTSAKFNNDYSYSSDALNCLHIVDRGNFTFLYE